LYVREIPGNSIVITGRSPGLQRFSHLEKMIGHDPLFRFHIEFWGKELSWGETMVYPMVFKELNHHVFIVWS
jgi:hypothetical protein